MSVSASSIYEDLGQRRLSSCGECRVDDDAKAQDAVSGRVLLRHVSIDISD
jgi:hypothetical protein